MLDYRFIAIYHDGTEYLQNDEDISVSDPGRSCFYDVDRERLAYFAIEGKGHIYAVSLVDGAFAVDGTPFRMHEGALKDIRLIFFRRHTHKFNIAHEELSHEIVYRLGWQAIDAEGENVQRIMEVD